MTFEELKKIPFHFVAHIAMKSEHTMIRASEDGRLGIFDYTKKYKTGNFGRTVRHWRIDDKVYKTKEEFIEALKDFDPKVKPIRP